MNKGVLRQWLEAGIMDKGVLSEGTNGVPQGGVISQMIANMV